MQDVRECLKNSPKYKNITFHYTELYIHLYESHVRENKNVLKKVFTIYNGEPRSSDYICGSQGPDFKESPTT